MTAMLFEVCLSAKLTHRRCLLHRSTNDGSDYGALHLGDVLLHSLKEASCAPLELAAAAFAGLGSVLAQSNVSPITLMCASTYNAASCTESYWSALVLFMCRQSCHVCAVQVLRDYRRSYQDQINVADMGRAMRRPGLLLRAQEMFPNAVGHVLAAIGTCMQGDRLTNHRSVAPKRRSSSMADDDDDDDEDRLLAGACLGGNCA